MNAPINEYEQDFNMWIHQQIQLLKSGCLQQLDVEHLIIELEEMSKSDLRALESRLLILIAHLLKWQFQLTTLTTQWQGFEGKSWRNTIIEQRAQLRHLLKKVPSLKREFSNAINEVYAEAVAVAEKETQLSNTIFPATCPYTMEQLLDDNFYPTSLAKNQ